MVKRLTSRGPVDITCSALALANASAEHVMSTGPLLVKRFTMDLSSFAGTAVYSDDTDRGGFSYTNAVSNPRNSAYRRMYGGKFNYGRF